MNIQLGSPHAVTDANQRLRHLNLHLIDQKKHVQSAIKPVRFYHQHKTHNEHSLTHTVIAQGIFVDYVALALVNKVGNPY